MRVFIAINLPQEIKNFIYTIVSRMQRDFRGAPIQWVGEDNFHITLHFLGNLEENEVEIVKNIIKESVENFQPVNLSLQRVGFFPNEFQPRVLWIGLDGDRGEGIRNLQKRIGKGLKEKGFEVDSRKWTSHITLGRINGKINAEKILSYCHPRAPKGIVEAEIHRKEFQVKSIDLMESKLYPDGARYKIIEKFELCN